DGKAVSWSLADWQTAPALDSVRDQAELAKLPDAERQQWQRLWADVATQLASDPVEQGRTHASRRDWASAADCYPRLEAWRDGRRPLLVRIRRRAAPVRRPPRLRQGLRPHGRAVWQALQSAVLSRGPCLHAGPRHRRGVIAGGAPARGRTRRLRGIL